MMVVMEGLRLADEASAEPADLVAGCPPAQPHPPGTDL